MDIKISCGGFELEYSGDEEFAKESLCKLVAEIKNIILAGEESQNSNAIQESESNGEMKLPAFVEKLEKRSERNTRGYRKFLITAAWLHLNGKKRLQTSDVAAALLENNFNSLSNPSDCLTTNIDYGHCERIEGNKFIVTRNGFQDLGIQLP